MSEKEDNEEKDESQESTKQVVRPSFTANSQQKNFLASFGDDVL